MNKTLRMAAVLVSAMVFADGYAQGQGGMDGVTGTGAEINYNRSGGKIKDDFTARASYRFYGNDHIDLAVNARYHFMGTDFPERGEAGYVPDMDGTHHVYQFGLNSSMRTRLLGKPFMALAMVTSDFSPEGFERISVMGGGLFMLTMTRETQFGVGAFLLLNTSSKWPLFPMIVYRHSFSPQLALNLYGRTFGFDYTPTDKDKFTAGFDIDSRTFYFRPGEDDLPEKCRYTANFFRPMVKYRRALAGGLHVEVEAGEEIKISSRVYERNGTKRYLNIKQSPKPFLSVALGYSL